MYLHGYIQTITYRNTFDAIRISILHWPLRISGFCVDIRSVELRRSSLIKLSTPDEYLLVNFKRLLLFKIV